MDLYEQIASRIGRPLNDLLIMSIEGACITQAEWDLDPDDCEARVHAAMEELYDFDL
jgi:hypothetical protein